MILKKLTVLCYASLGVSGWAAGVVEMGPLLDADAKVQWDAMSAQLSQRAVLEPLQKQAFNPEATLLATDKDPLDICIRRVNALLADLQAKLSPEAGKRWSERLGKLKTQCTGCPAEQRYSLYRELCALRREIAFANPLLNFDRLIAVSRRFSGGHMNDQFFGYCQKAGGGVVEITQPFGAEVRSRDLLAGAKVADGRLAGQELVGRGSFLSPSLSYDGKTLYFAWTELGGPVNAEAKKAWMRREISVPDQWTYDQSLDAKYKFNEVNTFHIFQIGIDGANLKQLTDGPWNEFDPCEMPNGRLVFISERRGGFGRCHGRYCPVYTLHTMKSDGSDIQTLSYHESNEWNPTINHDGMLVFTRWDYWDRGGNQAHHPWITTPDGYDPRALQGNYPANGLVRPNMELYIKPIPGSHRYLATAAPHHGHAFGSLVTIDPRAKDDEAMGALRRFTPEVPFPEVPEASSIKPRAKYATAWPLSENYCLAAYAPGNAPHGIYLVDAFGNKELLYQDKAIGLFFPMPIGARPVPPVIPSTVDEKNVCPPQTLTAAGKALEMGPVRVINVYDTDLPLPAGTHVSAIRVYQLVHKSSPLHNQPRMGYGTDKGARAVLGTVPVESDGSAHFLAPVNIPIFFQLLDEKGLAIHGMRSDTWVMRGQQLSCRGCHEHRQSAPKAITRKALAFQKPPVNITPDVAGSNPMSFPRLVQPVLDRNCVACHQKNAPKAPDLSVGDWKAHHFNWYTSYVNLQKYAFFYGSAPAWPIQGGGQYDGWTSSRSEPGKLGAKASKLYQLLVKGHHNLKLSAEDSHRLELWLDSSSMFFGACENRTAQAAGELVRPILE